MANIPIPNRSAAMGYPTSARKPVPETDLHRILMFALIDTLWEHFLSHQDVYVSGNLLVFYVPGNRRKHVSPDVFFVRGVEKKRRDNYLIWEEKRAPEVVIELTSKTTKNDDVDTKFKLYRDVLKVPEYFLFDPKGDYLEPRLQGYRLVQGDYLPVAKVGDRLPSQVLGLHLEQTGDTLRLWDPQTQELVPTPRESAEKRAKQAEQEVERLRKLVEELTRKNGPKG